MKAGTVFNLFMIALGVTECVFTYRAYKEVEREINDMMARDDVKKMFYHWYNRRSIDA